MNEKEIKDMIEPIPNWEFTYRYDCSRTCGKSYTQSLLDEKDKKIKDLQKKVEQLEKELNQEKEEFAGLHKVLNNKEEEFEKENYNNVVEISRLKRKIEQLENIRKEAIEYIKEDMYGKPNELYGLVDGEHLLNILNKGSDKE